MRFLHTLRSHMHRSRMDPSGMFPQPSTLRTSALLLTATPRAWVALLDHLVYNLLQCSLRDDA